METRIDIKCQCSPCPAQKVSKECCQIYKSFKKYICLLPSRRENNAINMPLILMRNLVNIPNCIVLVDWSEV